MTTSESTLSALRGDLHFEDCFHNRVLPLRSCKDRFSFWFRVKEAYQPVEWSIILEENGNECEIAFEVYDDE